MNDAKFIILMPIKIQKRFQNIIYLQKKLRLRMNIFVLLFAVKSATSATSAKYSESGVY